MKNIMNIDPYKIDIDMLIVLHLISKYFTLNKELKVNLMDMLFTILSYLIIIIAGVFVLADIRQFINYFVSMKGTLDNHSFYVRLCLVTIVLAALWYLGRSGTFGSNFYLIPLIFVYFYIVLFTKRFIHK